MSLTGVGLFQHPPAPPQASVKLPLIAEAIRQYSGEHAAVLHAAYGAEDDFLCLVSASASTASAFQLLNLK